jgi:hypothetical protein
MTIKPRFIFKKYAEYLLIIWIFLISIDVTQTVYAFTFYGSQVTEMNPLGYPLGIVFAYCTWFVWCSLVEFVSRARPYLFVGLIILSSGSVLTIIHNFMVLMQI